MLLQKSSPFLAWLTPTHLPRFSPDILFSGQAGLTLGCDPCKALGSRLWGTYHMAGSSWFSCLPLSLECQLTEGRTWAYFVFFP